MIRGSGAFRGAGLTTAARCTTRTGTQVGIGAGSEVARGQAGPVWKRQPGRAVTGPHYVGWLRAQGGSRAVEENLASGCWPSRVFALPVRWTLIIRGRARALASGEHSRPGVVLPVSAGGLAGYRLARYTAPWERRLRAQSTTVPRAGPGLPVQDGVCLGRAVGCGARGPGRSRSSPGCRGQLRRGSTRWRPAGRPRPAHP